jgi:hypothetical protein
MPWREPPPHSRRHPIHLSGRCLEFLLTQQYGIAGGYTGLCSLGKVAITVAGRTATHPAMVSEEAHFDVVLGRQWVERMNIK